MEPDRPVEPVRTEDPRSDEVRSPVEPSREDVLGLEEEPVRLNGLRERLLLERPENEPGRV